MARSAAQVLKWASAGWWSCGPDSRRCRNSGWCSRSQGGVAVERRVEMDLRIDAPLVAVEAVVRMAPLRLHHAPRHVQLADQRGLVAEPLQMRRQQHLVFGQGVVQTVHAVPRQRLAGQHAGAARRAVGGVHVAALEQHAARGQTVQGRRGNGATAIAAERIPALLIAHDEQDVRPLLHHAKRACRKAGSAVKRTRVRRAVRPFPERHERHQSTRTAVPVMPVPVVPAVAASVSLGARSRWCTSLEWKSSSLTCWFSRQLPLVSGTSPGR